MNLPLFFLVSLFLGWPLLLSAQTPPETGPAAPIDRDAVQKAQILLGLDFSEKEVDGILGGLKAQRGRFETLRTVPLNNGVPPSLVFNPIPIGFVFETNAVPCQWSPARNVELPAHRDDLAFYSVADMAALIRSRRITSEALTQFHLDRLKKFGPGLECVVTLTENLALEQARRADREIAAGHYRGLLHGIPYGAKDLLATKGAKTTWGSAAFKDQEFQTNATVVQRLEEAGAVLVAKLTTGELAWDDLWYGGKTRNPWNPKQGSSGSSAGPASATAAGLVPFAIGSETLGSIVSPSSRCGTTGLRPTFGRISRQGAMTLSWSMDKIGPIGRTVEDCAVVFDAIRGPDGIDQTLVACPFNYDPQVRLENLRIGYLKDDFERAKKHRMQDQAALDKLTALGAKLIPLNLPDLPVDALIDILYVEGAAAFDEFTRTDRDELLQREEQANWFRRGRFVPAVEYLQAQRIRHRLIQAMHQMMQGIDVYIAPTSGGSNLMVTNLSGHPCVVVPHGFNEDGTPTSICFMGPLFGEARLLAVARLFQESTAFHLQHPDLDKVETPKEK